MELSVVDHLGHREPGPRALFNGSEDSGQVQNLVCFARKIVVNPVVESGSAPFEDAVEGRVGVNVVSACVTIRSQNNGWRIGNAGH